MVGLSTFASFLHMNHILSIMLNTLFIENLVYLNLEGALRGHMTTPSMTDQPTKSFPVM